jgi:hypothetical protein
VKSIINIGGYNVMLRLELRHKNLPTASHRDVLLTFSLVSLI